MFSCCCGKGKNKKPIVMAGYIGKHFVGREGKRQIERERPILNLLNSNRSIYKFIGLQQLWRQQRRHQHPVCMRHIPLMHNAILKCWLIFISNVCVFSLFIVFCCDCYKRKYTNKHGKMLTSWNYQSNLLQRIDSTFPLNCLVDLSIYIYRNQNNGYLSENVRIYRLLVAVIISTSNMWFSCGLSSLNHITSEIPVTRCTLHQNRANPCMSICRALNFDETCYMHF